jgi:hypothetical protein
MLPHACARRGVHLHTHFCTVVHVYDTVCCCMSNVAVQRDMGMCCCAMGHADIAVRWRRFTPLYTKHAGAEYSVQWCMFTCMYITKHVGGLLVQFPPTLDVKCCLAACSATWLLWAIMVCRALQCVPSKALWSHEESCLLLVASVTLTYLYTASAVRQCAVRACAVQHQVVMIW